jgi:hypothetical protein
MNTEGEKETMTGEGIGLPAIVMSPLKKNWRKSKRWKPIRCSSKPNNKKKSQKGKTALYWSTGYIWNLTNKQFTSSLKKTIAGKSATSGSSGTRDQANLKGKIYFNSFLSIHFWIHYDFLKLNYFTHFKNVIIKMSFDLYVDCYHEKTAAVWWIGLDQIKSINNSTVV